MNTGGVVWLTLGGVLCCLSIVGFLVFLYKMKIGRAEREEPDVTATSYITEPVPSWVDMDCEVKKSLSKNQVALVRLILHQCKVKRLLPGAPHTDCVICMDAATVPTASLGDRTLTPPLTPSLDPNQTPHLPYGDDGHLTAFDDSENPLGCHHTSRQWTTLPCKHSFHEGCLGTWLITEFEHCIDPTCPICRQGIMELIWPVS